MAYTLGGSKYLDLIKKNTHTCYKGQRDTYYDWGYGCNDCPACLLRSKGWKNFIKNKETK